ncbi:hypothetical protein B0H11DRAFT_2038381 [Mycena galericulata]|nr:hypothetical protein B0H11DRAFT_2038381 [Mycena galericulata]
MIMEIALQLSAYVFNYVLLFWVVSSVGDSHTSSSASSGLITLTSPPPLSCSTILCMFWWPFSPSTSSKPAYGIKLGSTGAIPLNFLPFFDFWRGSGSGRGWEEIVTVRAEEATRG